jgi:dienelactone hydrolase
MLLIHGGGFHDGSTTSSPEMVQCAQDLAAAGYLALAIEYRLAPPGLLPGQISDGRFPDQNDDVNLAVRTARSDARCNGQVGAIGGSAGGYHVAYAATTGTVGFDRVDVGVSLSGLFDMTDFSANAHLAGYTDNVTNYMNVTTSDTAALQAGSPAWLADKDTTPLLLINSTRDSMPYSQLPDMIQHLDAVGLANYQVLSLAGGNHAWANWPFVKGRVLTFIANGFAGVPPPPPLPTPGPGDVDKKLLNVSTRANVSTGDDVMVGGFIVTGNVDKRVVLRGLGPTLTQQGVSGVLANPYLEIYDSTGVLIEANDNRTALAGVPNPLLPANPNESYLTAVLPPGSYTAVLSGVAGTAGIGLVELYDVDPTHSFLANISTRGIVEQGDLQMIGGFIVGGTDPAKVIVRALGPSLAAAGIASPLPDPVLEVHDGNGNLLVKNDNWRSNQEEEIIATTIPPANDQEAAIVATLPPGDYTALVYDSEGRSGIGLVESYNLEPQ